ncbi:hypothetical protein [Glaciecola sp. 1036]|uniref:hypothetical protein n=1 Tax=Alteromonadaceae TaxID=72275 RepID=UPI003D0957A6
MSIETEFDDRIAVAVKGDMPVNQAKALLKRDIGLDESEINVVTPDDARVGEKLEMNSTQLGEKMLWWHIFFGFIGFLIGMFVAFLLVQFGPPLTQENPIFTFIALVSPGIFLGLFVAGALSLKPENDAQNLAVMSRQAHRLPTLLIKPRSTRNKDDIKSAVKSINGLTLVEE